MEILLRSLVTCRIYGYVYTLSLEELQLLVSNVVVLVYQD